MKRILIITDIILVLTAVLLIFALHHDVRPALAPTVTAEETTIEGVKGTKVNVGQIKVGNFETIHGNWGNPESDIDERKVSISGNTVTKNKRDFHIRYGGVDEYTKQIYLWMYLDGIAPENGSRFEIYPEGTFIPVKLSDGSIDYSGKHDPTDKGKDRILMEGSARTVEELRSLVLYRDAGKMF